MSNRHPFLDGIRAIAALYVFASHAYSLQFDPTQSFWLIALPFAFGDLAVVTFLVLSGFVLGLQMHKQQSFWSYIGRRSRRILPPYYGAIVVCLLLLILRQRANGVELLPDLTALAPNLLLVKDLFPDYSDWLIGSVVFWSIGLEYRLYWLLPVLAWCDRHWGVLSVGAVALACTIAAFGLLTAFHLSTYRCWYIMLFAFGVMTSQATKMEAKTVA